MTSKPSEEFEKFDKAKAAKTKRDERLKKEKPIPERAKDDPFTEEDFDAVLRKVLRKTSPASQSDEAKK
jgi:hypothetical protein